MCALVRHRKLWILCNSMHPDFILQRNRLLNPTHAQISWYWCPMLPFLHHYENFNDHCRRLVCPSIIYFVDLESLILHDLFINFPFLDVLILQLLDGHDHHQCFFRNWWRKFGPLTISSLFRPFNVLMDLWVDLKISTFTFSNSLSMNHVLVSIWLVHHQKWLQISTTKFRIVV